MGQLHKRFSDQQIRLLFHGYCQGQLRRADLQDMLGIGKTRFFALLKRYRRDPAGFSLVYRRCMPARLPTVVEVEIERALRREKEILADADLPISGYNNTAIKDRMAANGMPVSMTTKAANTPAMLRYLELRAHEF